MKKLLAVLIGLVACFSMAGCMNVINGIKDKIFPSKESAEISSDDETASSNITETSSSTVEDLGNSSVDSGETEPHPKDGNKVLLISVDALRPDAFIKTEHFEKLKLMGNYSLTGKTINPSSTLPSHMSMFYGVQPSVHGVKTNTYKPSKDLRNGIIETLNEAGKTAAMFYDWKELEDLAKDDADVERNYFEDKSEDKNKAYEGTTKDAAEACIDHIQNTPTDFTFLYFTITDDRGHRWNWMSNEYYDSIDYVFSYIYKVLEVVPDDYTVIITSDHGGGGTNGPDQHGSKADVDMTIPIFIIGEDYHPGGMLSNFSITDVAPTVMENLGVKPEIYWTGKYIEPVETTAKYTVKHYTQEFNGTQTLVETEVLTGMGTVEANKKVFEGYTYAEGLSVSQGELKADDSLVLEMVYTNDEDSFYASEELEAVFVNGGSFERQAMEGVHMDNVKVGTYFFDSQNAGDKLRVTYAPAESNMYFLLHVYYTDLQTNSVGFWNASDGAENTAAIWASNYANGLWVQQNTDYTENQWFTYVFKLDSNYCPAHKNAFEISLSKECANDFYVGGYAFVTEERYFAWYNNGEGAENYTTADYTAEVVLIDETRTETVDLELSALFGGSGTIGERVDITNEAKALLETEEKLERYQLDTAKSILKGTLSKSGANAKFPLKLKVVYSVYSTNENAAFDILRSADSWGGWKHGLAKEVTSEGNTITIKGTYNPNSESSSKVTGMLLKAEAIKKWVELGFERLTFTIDLSADPGYDLPTMIDMYLANGKTDFFETEPHMVDPAYDTEYYYEDESTITLNLVKLVNALGTNGNGLQMALMQTGVWNRVDDGYLTLTNVIFTKAKPIAEQAFKVLADENSWGAYKHGMANSVTSTKDTITVEGVINSSSEASSLFTGMLLKADAIRALVALGIEKMTFTIGLTTATGTGVPTHIDMYLANGRQAGFVTAKDLSDPNFPREYYYANGTTVTLNLNKLANDLFPNENGLQIVFSEYIWTETSDAYLTLSNIIFTPFKAMCQHEWIDATCETAKTCTICGAVDGDVPGHNWIPETENSLKTCATCGLTPMLTALEELQKVESWGTHNHGTVTTVETTADGLKVGGTKNSSNFTGFMLKQETIENLLEIGYDRMTFTILLSADDASNVPGCVDIYVTGGNGSYFETEPAAIEGGNEYFFNNNTRVTINLKKLAVLLESIQDPGNKCLKFVFTKTAAWSGQATNADAYLTFSNVRFAEKEELKAETIKSAFSLLASESSWGAYKHGKVVSVTSTEDTIKVEGGVNPNSSSGSKFTGVLLKASTIKTLVMLGIEKITFTIGLSADPDATVPTHVDMYLGNTPDTAFFETEPNFRDSKDPRECYFADGATITINLVKLDGIIGFEGNGLQMAFSVNEWTATGNNAYLTISNIIFA